MKPSSWFRALLHLSSLTAVALAMTTAGQGQIVTHAMNQAAIAVPAGERDAAISPEELVKLLQVPKGDQPIILNVGPRLLYAQAHIPGAEYIAPGSSSASNEMLKKRVQAVPHGRSIVLYCGCCPWSRCPNIHPAYDELRSMGFTKVKMLYIANNFGADWVDKGYPTAKEK